ncbi:hypothetical protein JHK82_028063 [Glycine max]|nr:hypothetical protein JHK85_028728 [Glycine max]KAG5127228.1 hypothetical protein JHK82_028063 [Glycine max]KAG5151840.1 hypothetical protein JHK84_028312 [Glycine max]
MALYTDADDAAMAMTMFTAVGLDMSEEQCPGKVLPQLGLLGRSVLICGPELLVLPMPFSKSFQAKGKEPIVSHEDLLAMVFEDSDTKQESQCYEYLLGMVVEDSLESEHVLPFYSNH